MSNQDRRSQTGQFISGRAESVSDIIFPFSCVCVFIRPANWSSWREKERERDVTCGHFQRGQLYSRVAASSALSVYLSSSLPHLHGASRLIWITDERPPIPPSFSFDFSLTFFFTFSCGTFHCLYSCFDIKPGYIFFIAFLVVPGRQ